MIPVWLLKMRAGLKLQMTSSQPIWEITVLLTLCLYIYCLYVANYCDCNWFNSNLEYSFIVYPTISHLNWLIKWSHRNDSKNFKNQIWLMDCILVLQWQKANHYIQRSNNWKDKERRNSTFGYNLTRNLTHSKQHIKLSHSIAILTLCLTLILCVT